MGRLFHRLPNASDSHLGPTTSCSRERAAGAAAGAQLSATRGAGCAGPCSQPQRSSRQERRELSGQAPGSSDFMEIGRFKLEQFSRSKNKTSTKPPLEAPRRRLEAESKSAVMGHERQERPGTVPHPGSPLTDAPSLSFPTHRVGGRFQGLQSSQLPVPVTAAPCWGLGPGLGLEVPFQTAGAPRGRESVSSLGSRGAQKTRRGWGAENGDP